MQNNISPAAGAALGIGLILFLIFLWLAFYLFSCFCMKRICEKCGVTPGLLIWIPIVHFIPLLQVVKLPVWTIILLFVPLVNLVLLVMVFAKLSIARGKSGWLVIMIFIPLVNLAFLPYLAFSE